MRIKTGVRVSADRPLYKVDRIMESASGGVLWGFHLASPLSFARQGAPVTLDPMADYIGVHGAGDVELATAGVVTFAGGGFDFSAVGSGANTREFAIRPPVAVSAALHAGDQSWLICNWVRLPTQADYNDSAAIAPFFSFSDSTLGWTNAVDMITVAQRYADPNRQIVYRRQTAGAASATDNIDITLDAEDFGKVAMIMAWRDVARAQRGLLVRTSAGMKHVVLDGAGAKNTGDFSAVRAGFGIPKPFWFNAAEHADAAKYRQYRGWIEDLEVSGRNPLVEESLNGPALQEFEWRNHSGRFV